MVAFNYNAPQERCCDACEEKRQEVIDLTDAMAAVIPEGTPTGEVILAATTVLDFTLETTQESTNVEVTSITKMRKLIFDMQANIALAIVASLHEDAENQL